MKTVDLTGQKFTHLYVVEKYGTRNNRVLWKCRCDCGNETIVDTSSLTTHNTKSCGCKKYGGRFRHGDSKTPKTQTRLYRIWAGMKNRCKNESHIGYYLYGGKGIAVCDEWNDYCNFKEWAEANGYNDTLTIDREDSNKDYCPENCRWVPYETQSNNTSRNHYVTAYGETLTISQWSKKSGIPSRTIAARLNLLHWEPSEAVSIPTRGVRHG